MSRLQKLLVFSAIIAAIGIASPPSANSQEFEFGQASMLSYLLNQESVIAELELSKSQNQKMKQVQNELATIESEYVRSVSKVLNSPELIEPLKVELEQKMATAGNKLLKELLPHQKKRLGQLFRRFWIYNTERQIEHLSLSKTLTHLELSKKQEELIKERARIHANEVKMRVEKFKEELRKLAKTQKTEMLSLLNKEQQKKFDDAVGASFSFRESFTPSVTTRQNNR